MAALLIIKEDGSYSFARSGEAEIKLARGLSPSVVITDLFLPGLNGIAAAQAIKALPRTHHHPNQRCNRNPSQGANPALRSF